MKNIYKVSLGAAATLALLFVLDRVVGCLMAAGYRNAKYGIIHRQEYCLRESSEDILIMGSSRAAHHYVPEIFTDSLGLTCYNCGSDGQCVYYTYAMLSAYIERGVIPKMVICEVMPQDIELWAGSTFNFDAAAERLAPVYGEFACIDSLLKSQGWKYRLKLLSQVYRYNSKLVQVIKCNFIGEVENNGYEPLFGTSPVVHATDDVSAGSATSIEQGKLNSFRNLIALCKRNRIDLIMAYSPTQNRQHSIGIDVAKSIAESSGVPFIDMSRDSHFEDAALFKDGTHLNDTGARKYSTILAGIISNRIAP